MTQTSTAAKFTADDLRAAFLALDVRTIPLHEMWRIVANRATLDDYRVAVDTLRRENRGKGFDVTVTSFGGGRELSRVAETVEVDYAAQMAAYASKFSQADIAEGQALMDSL